MAHRLAWKDLGIGIAAACLVTGGAMAILFFGRVGTLKGKTFRIYVTTDAARGLIKGSDVWLDGQRVGLVKRISFRPPTTTQKERLVLALDVLDFARGHVRADTRVQIRAGGNVIGNQVVYLSSGSATQQGLADGDTLRGGQQTDMEGMTSDAALASKEFPRILENVTLLAAGLRSIEGTLGAFGLDTMSNRRIAALKARSGRIKDQLSDSRGSVRLAFRAKDHLLARAVQAMARVDTVRVLMTSDRQSIGRFRRDSTLIREIAQLREEVAEVQRLAADPSGTIGRIRSDSAITRSIHRDLMALDSLMADMRKHPFRYIVF
jgi:hypothetical protein